MHSSLQISIRIQNTSSFFLLMKACIPILLTVVELFHENQVFEKMMIQHEYLHQISFEEVLEYVEKIIMEGSKELVVYHGSCYEFENIDLNKSHNRRDFGKGFYTTILQSQSKEWGYSCCIIIFSKT